MYWLTLMLQISVYCQSENKVCNFFHSFWWWRRRKRRRIVFLPPGLGAYIWMYILETGSTLLMLYTRAGQAMNDVYFFGGYKKQKSTGVWDMRFYGQSQTIFLRDGYVFRPSQIETRTQKHVVKSDGLLCPLVKNTWKEVQIELLSTSIFIYKKGANWSSVPRILRAAHTWRNNAPR